MFNKIIKKQKERIESLEQEKEMLEIKQQEFINEAKNLNKLYEMSFNELQARVVYILSEIQAINSAGNTEEEKRKRINAIIYKFKKEMNI